MLMAHATAYGEAHGALHKGCFVFTSIKRTKHKRFFVYARYL